jgi:hypothetical protein
VSDFTTEKSVLTRSLDEMYVEGGLSAITDAVYFSARHMAEKGETPGTESYRRALILITDGAEESSYYRLGPVLSLLREKKIPVYVVGFPQALERQGLKAQERAVRYLNKIVESSRGRAYFPKTSAEIETVANTILSDIRSGN